MINLAFIRELRILQKNSNLWLFSFMFYVITVLTLPIALNNSNVNLIDLAPLIMWLTFILSSIHLVTNVFTADHRNGWYQQVMIHQTSLTMFFLLKMIAIILIFILPVIFVTPLLSIAYNLTWQSSMILCLSMLVAAPSICLISGIFAALVVGSYQRGALLNIMILPLCTPIYILGVGSFVLFNAQLNPYPNIALLAAISLLNILGAPYLIAVSVRNGFEY